MPSRLIRMWFNPISKLCYPYQHVNTKDKKQTHSSFCIQINRSAGVSGFRTHWRNMLCERSWVAGCEMPIFTFPRISAWLPIFSDRIRIVASSTGGKCVDCVANTWKCLRLPNDIRSVHKRLCQLKINGNIKEKRTCELKTSAADNH